MIIKYTRFSLLLTLLLITGCASQYANQNPLGKQFPSVAGQSLDNKHFSIPESFSGRQVLLLLGYKQDSQFDIDRWLIGLDMTQTAIDVYEIPTIQGLFPRMFKTNIDNGMRAGIPKQLWKGVITVYKDGEMVQSFTGNQNPNNARVLLLDSSGQVMFFYDRGFSVDALNALKEQISA